MSGGSMNYIYSEMKEVLCGQMEDVELDDLVNDIADLAHDLEWYKSGDYAQEHYQDSVKKFKAKWLKGSRRERLKGYVDRMIDDLRDEILRLMQ